MLQQVASLGVNFLSLTLQVDVEALTVETGWSHSEIHKGDTRAEIGREDSILVPREHEKGKFAIAGNLFVSDLHHETTSHFLHFLVQHRVHHWVDLLHILHENGNSVL